jgi:plasmid stabilization system protein ParE
MDNKEYTLRYLPLFERDVEEVRNYIAGTLHNPTAALRLINDTEAAIKKRLASPTAFEPFRSAKDRKHVYYRINIRNFSVFYVVIGDVMEVRRFVYSKRDLTKIV